LSRTLAGDHILRNHPTFAPTDVFDFLREQSAALAAARQAAVWSALLGIFFQMLFAGGIVATLNRAGGFAWKEFFEGCRWNLWHNTKCLAIFVLLLAFVPGIWIAAAVAADRTLFGLAPPWSAARHGYRLGAAVVALLLFAVLSLVYDFARAARRENPSVGAWSAFGVARRTLMAAPFRALGLFLFWLIFGAGVVVALFGFEWAGKATSAAGVAVHTALQAVVILARSAVRVGTWGSLLTLFDERISERSLRGSIPSRGDPAREAAETFLDAVEPGRKREANTGVIAEGVSRHGSNAGLREQALAESR
jgi:hypothetical protein